MITVRVVSNTATFKDTEKGIEMSLTKGKIIDILDGNIDQNLNYLDLGIGGSTLEPSHISSITLSRSILQRALAGLTI